jgi:hypothetical protein
LSALSLPTKKSSRYKEFLTLPGSTPPNAFSIHSSLLHRMPTSEAQFFLQFDRAV